MMVDVQAACWGAPDGKSVRACQAGESCDDGKEGVDGGGISRDHVANGGQAGEVGCHQE